MNGMSVAEVLSRAKEISRKTYIDENARYANILTTVEKRIQATQAKIAQSQEKSDSEHGEAEAKKKEALATAAQVAQIVGVEDFKVTSRKGRLAARGKYRVRVSNIFDEPIQRVSLKIFLSPKSNPQSVLTCEQAYNFAMKDELVVQPGQSKTDLVIGKANSVPGRAAPNHPLSQNPDDYNFTAYALNVRHLGNSRSRVIIDRFALGSGVAPPSRRTTRQDKNTLRCKEHLARLERSLTNIRSYREALGKKLRLQDLPNEPFVPPSNSSCK